MELLQLRGVLTRTEHEVLQRAYTAITSNIISCRDIEREIVLVEELLYRISEPDLREVLSNYLTLLKCAKLCRCVGLVE